MVAGAEVVGLTSGASAPEMQFQAILRRLQSLGASAIEEIVLREETMAFVAPRELAAVLSVVQS